MANLPPKTGELQGDNYPITINEVLDTIEEKGGKMSLIDAYICTTFKQSGETVLAFQNKVLEACQLTQFEYTAEALDVLEQMENLIGFLVSAHLLNSISIGLDFGVHFNPSPSGFHRCIADCYLEAVFRIKLLALLAPKTPIDVPRQLVLDPYDVVNNLEQMSLILPQKTFLGEEQCHWYENRHLQSL